MAQTSPPITGGIIFENEAYYLTRCVKLVKIPERQQLAASDNLKRADRILDAAAKLIVHYGYDKTTVNEIADAARVSKGAIYLHWKSKEDLFEALIFRESERVIDDLLKRIGNDPDGGTVFHLYQQGIISIIANPLIHALITQDIRVLGDFVRRWNDTGLNNRSHFFRTEFVRQLQAARVFRDDLDAEVVSYIMALIRYGFLTVGDVIPSDQTPPLETVGKVLAEMMQRALAPDDGGDPEAGRQVMAGMIEMMKSMIQKKG